MGTIVKQMTREETDSMKKALLELRQHQITQLVFYVAEQFTVKQCPQSAAALTYMTLFAVVPLMTVTYSMFSVFPLFEGLETRLDSVIFDHMVPETGQEVKQYLREFTAQARGLSAAGVGMLVVTAYLMLKNIEKNFNRIWGVVQGRKGLSNFLLYWAVLSVGPLLLGIGLAMSTYVISLKLLVTEIDPLAVAPWVFKFVPWLLTSAMFTLLFAAVPNCRVPLKSALLGGLVTGLCFELVKDLFGFMVSQTSYSAIYGAFAFVPLFLLWIYVLWMIVLAGAVLVRALATYDTIVAGYRYPDLVAALVALWHFQQDQTTGATLNDGQLLKAGVESDQWQRVRDTLLKEKVITATQQGGYVLCRELRGISLRELAGMLQLRPQRPTEIERLQQYPWYPTLAARLADVDRHIDQQFSVAVADVLSAAGSGESSTGPDKVISAALQSRLGES